jgi:alkanesulfonate monooxygenase SsuD/methylene tetrahydromethanopterin reductase-like flavin-dependent oxidoreductase (luciferase family)
VARRAEELGRWRGAPVDLAAPETATWVAGTPAQVIERLRTLEAAGVARVYLQLLLHRDLEAVELIGREIAPAVA